ncbi:MAG: hypothetical protein MUP22_09645 [Desulfobacterales bacterium]|nr:hypothetical protein [Desulfobacterales bacterium]
MTGSAKISDEEKQEMLRDAMDSERGRVFNSARILSEQGSIDGYIDFLSENMPLIAIVPSKPITPNYKL